MTETTAASKPGSEVLIVPAFLLAFAMVIGSVAQGLLCFWSWMKPVHEALKPCGEPFLRGLVAALVLAIWWMVHRFHPLAI